MKAVVNLNFCSSTCKRLSGHRNNELI